MRVYKNSRGEDIVSKFLEGVSSSVKVSIIKALEVLDKDKQNLNKTLNTKPLRHPVFELKKGQVRVAYIYYQNDIMVVHIFFKDSQKTEEKDIDLALKRVKKYL